MAGLQPKNQDTTIEIANQTKPEIDPWAVKAFVVAGSVGAGAGLLAAYLLVNNKNYQRMLGLPVLEQMDL